MAVRWGEVRCKVCIGGAVGRYLHGCCKVVPGLLGGRFKDVAEGCYKKVAIR